MEADAELFGLTRQISAPRGLLPECHVVRRRARVSECLHLLGNRHTFSKFSLWSLGIAPCARPLTLENLWQ